MLKPFDGPLPWKAPGAAFAGMSGSLMSLPPPLTGHPKP